MSVSPWLRQTRRMRLLLGGDFGGDFGGELSAGGALDRAQLSAAYAVPPGPWLRTNFVASLDGACAGADGLSGSLNNVLDLRTGLGLKDRDGVNQHMRVWEQLPSLRKGG